MKNALNNEEKAMCCNCAHCIVLRYNDPSDKDKYVLRIRCENKKWIKRSGEEKYYKYFTVARRIQPDCDEYKPMGEFTQYIKNLKRELPIKDEIYTAKKYKAPESS